MTGEEFYEEASVKERFEGLYATLDIMQKENKMLREKIDCLFREIDKYKEKQATEFKGVTMQGIHFDPKGRGCIED